MSASRFFGSTQNTAIACGLSSSLILIAIFGSPQQQQQQQQHGSTRPHHLFTVEMLDSRIETKLADPSLDETKKNRLSTRYSALLDCDAAFVDSISNAKKLWAASKRTGEMDAETKAKYYKSTLAGLAQEQLALDKEASSQLWRASSVCMFAPWGDITFIDRVVNLSGLIWGNALILPVTRSSMRVYYRWCNL
jgi:hypothetical protein